MMPGSKRDQLGAHVQGQILILSLFYSSSPKKTNKREIEFCRLTFVSSETRGRKRKMAGLKNELKRITKETFPGLEKGINFKSQEHNLSRIRISKEIHAVMHHSKITEN